MSNKYTTNDLLIFAELRFTKSFTKCAENLAITKASVSRAIARLEAHFEVALLSRSPRGVNFTSAGELLLKRAVNIENEIKSLSQEMTSFMSEAKGSLRIAAPSAIAMYRLSPLIAEFSAMHPNIDIELDLVERTINPVTEHYDLVLTWFPPKERLVYAKHIRDYNVVIVASPTYLKQHGEPQNPCELADHNCLHYKYYSGKKTWQFEYQNNTEVHPAGGRFTVETSSLLLPPLLAGLGIARVPQFLIENELELGHLVKLFEQYKPNVAKLYGVYVNKSTRDPVVTKFFEFIENKL